MNSKDTAKTQEPKDPRFSPPAVSLPKGGGAIRGIGEKFSVAAVTGTGSLRVPIAVTPGRSGFSPDVALSYDSGVGNGPFGSGWRLSVPNITRKTDKQLPTYDGDNDVFVLSGVEDLVPLGTAGGVTRYQPRVEGGFSRIERTVDAIGDVSWSSTTADNVHNIYGTSTTARLTDPLSSERVFRWLLERTEDSFGNVVAFDYIEEDLVGVDSVPAEQHRLAHLSRITNRYLKQIRYGNTIPGDDSSWVFAVVFDYGDHDDDVPKLTPTDAWPVRSDAFSSYRAGFEIRTYRRCQRVLVFHRFAELAPAIQAGQPIEPCLVRSTKLTYDDDPALSHLIAIEQRHHVRSGTDVYVTEALPPVSFGYTPVELHTDVVETVHVDTLGDLPGGVNGTNHQWVDLDAEGLPGVLTNAEQALYYRRNLGHGVLGPIRQLLTRPSTADLFRGGQQLMDLGGDGRLDLVEFGPPFPGFYERIPAGDAELTPAQFDDGDWEPFHSFASRPSIDWADGNIRFIDLDGDGLDDILIAQDDKFVWYPSLGKSGFGPARILPRPSNEELGPAIVFADPTHSVALADISGDGLRDLVRVENGRICYWPNLGHGKFGAKVTMANPPTFDAPDQFEAKRVLFADIDGSGTSDLLYVARDGVRFWLNHAGNAWGAPNSIPNLPPDTSVASVTAVDLLGTGTACLVWSSPAPADGSATIRYLDLLGSKKPHLLAEVDNHLGFVTRTQYAPSTKFYLADRAVGRRWTTHLGFPVHVVERVETYDAVRRVRFVSEYKYRDGYFDGYEREFRGFGYVEQWDTESASAGTGIGLFADRPPPVNHEYAQPPVVTKTWFHTGAWLAAGVTSTSPPIVIPGDLTPGESRDAYRALRGSVLRQEIACEDGSTLAPLPYSTSEHGYEVRCLRRAVGETHGVFASHSRETIERHYERDLSDPRTKHELTIEVDDFGHVRRAVAIGYPRGFAATDARPEQRQLLATLTETDVANEVDHLDWYRHGVPLESRTFELRGFPAPGDLTTLSFEAVKIVADAAVAIAYDAAVPNGASKRMLKRSLTRYYNSTSLPVPLPFGAIDARALPYENYGLAFTSSLVARLYGDRITDANLSEGGYRHLDDPVDEDGASGWWVPSGRSLPDAAKFFLPVAFHDPFGNPPTTVTYDDHLLAISSVADARQNTTRSVTDYRVMSPSKITDINGNQTSVDLDVLGRVVAVWMMGNPARSEGDRPPGEPTEKLDYAFYDAGTNRPSFVHSASRETHSDPNTRWQHSYSYSDGAGHEVMKKVQAEPGPALQLQLDGKCVTVNASPRWVGNGRTVFDNKGNPIKKYEPYFSVTPDYDDEDSLVCQGVTPLLHYDPLGRLILTEHPDGSTERIDFTPWLQRSYDGNDTVLDPDNIWFARAQASSDPALARAATITREHANTPAVTLSDSLGRTFATIADNGGGQTLETRTTFDIEGNPLIVWDALGRSCMTHGFNILGQPCYQSSIDAGERWTLVNVSGKPLRQWDSRGQTISNVYDVLQRPTEVRVKQPVGPELLAETIKYGEDYPGDPTLFNLRGKVYEHRDGAGVAKSSAYDFKGNLLGGSRQLAASYRSTPDWSQAIALENEAFTTATEYDALNRPTRITAPDGSVIQPNYNEASLLEKVEARIRGADQWTSFVGNIDYNEKGQRTAIVYGAAAAPAARTAYKYEPLTFRLAKLTTTRANGPALQDIAYTYDPVGNIVQISDAVQQPVYFKNAVVDGTALYWYEPVYRLRRAQAREHAGGRGADGPRTDEDLPIEQLPNENDGQALRPYIEQYTYDDVGNILSIDHRPNGSAPWKSPMQYFDGTNRLRATMAVGDDAMQPSQWHSLYTYDPHGNMTSMPHLRQIDWDWKDQMQRADKGGGGAVYFTYDSSGERVRKVWEHGGTIEERIYLGGYEVYRVRKNSAPTLERQTLHIMDGMKRIAMVETKTIDTSIPALTPISITRFQLGNHLGSVTLEIDDTGQLISYEEYHPYGTSAYRAANSAIEVGQKRYRYTGKERDEETGLEYHGARYYSPWIAIWTSCDPAGLRGGISLFAYGAANPIRFGDSTGMEPDMSTKEKFEDGWKAFDPEAGDYVPVKGPERQISVRVDVPESPVVGINPIPPFARVYRHSDTAPLVLKTNEVRMTDGTIRMKDQFEPDTGHAWVAFETGDTRGNIEVGWYPVVAPENPGGVREGTLGELHDDSRHNYDFEAKFAVDEVAFEEALTLALSRGPGYPPQNWGEKNACVDFVYDVMSKAGVALPDDVTRRDVGAPMLGYVRMKMPGALALEMNEAGQGSYQSKEAPSLLSNPVLSGARPQFEDVHTKSVTGQQMVWWGHAAPVTLTPDP